jgi:hypothetical protein
MTTPRITDLAAEFWSRVDVPASFPRDLEQAALLAAPIWVVRQSDLRPRTARSWLCRRGFGLPLTVRDRPLDGCIVAYRGRAVIFLEAGLAAAQTRVIFAHEFGHYLADYESPRRRVLRRLGPSVLPVLDGERQPTPAEELAAVLAGVPLGVHVHYMERSRDPRLTAATSCIERTASALACELLAPREEALAVAHERGLPSRPEPWRRLLVERFGFPDAWAGAYALRLLVERRRRRRFTDRLGL